MSEHKPRKTPAPEQGKTEFGRQVDNMQNMLQRVEIYGNKLTAQIHNIKRLVRTNQNVVAQLKANEKALKSLIEAKHKPKPVKAALKENVSCGQRSSKQLLGVRTRLNSIGQELERLRPHRSSSRVVKRSPRRVACKAASIQEICWSQCKPTTEGCLPPKEVKAAGCAPELHRERTALVEALKLDLDDRQRAGRDVTAAPSSTESRNVQLQRHQTLIERVENILESVENLNMRTETVSDVKILCSLVLNALIQRKKILLQQPPRCEKLQQENKCNRLTFSKVCQTSVCHINPYI
ncbi:uncharacterized protein LOC111067663 [Drosophila obscura]|uniref:uncharacterized protein LOC111067663 n=1 Tax=Drosophila obscura TaxID=7282 RepID=UPI000B9FE603|nr:uncharacterized protein LOC111067663 [Drosophila obscura]